ncbi:L-aspartate oxidase [Flavicella sp.]|uniref:L-aspartate oxidase n=1 Tax=Flavicella sp. TaxID=2957742 RepID=UPI00301B207F
MIKTDYLVVGSGIAGLTYALRVAHKSKESKVIIVTKEDKGESNTKYAQGGIATVYDLGIDSFEQHVQDTLIAGDGLCNEEVVRMVVEEGPARLQELIDWGVKFDENNIGDFDLGKEGGHSQNRILHHKDITGHEIERALLVMISKTENIHIFEKHYAIDFITEHHLSSETEDRKSNITCFGAYVLDKESNEVKTIVSKITMVASGGSGQAYATTTNPLIATGDGVGMAYRAKAEIGDVEFIQFHPTALYQMPQESPAFLISEAVRGFGAKLRTSKGEFFMCKYDEREDLASRDIVARAIDTELKVSGDNYVFLDCTHLNHKKFKKHFPNILDKCKSLGIDIRRTWIPVVTAAHYICGGIKVDIDGRTSIRNLYACGECTFTGLHGANRLASNSLLEALVYSQRSYLKSVVKIENVGFNEDVPEWDTANTSQNKENILITHGRSSVQKIMSDYVGIVRSNRRLKSAEKRLSFIYEETEELYKESIISVELCELRNLITTAYLICEFSMKRKENKGGFFNKDFV